MAASNSQVQTFVNDRMRPHCEDVRDTVLRLDDDIAHMDDVYANLTNSPNWTDQRLDSPPILLSPNDVLAFNSFIHDIRDAIKNHSAWPVIQKACVRGL